MLAATSISDNSADMARVYFALWPPEPIRDALTNLAEHLQRTCGGRVMHRSSLHCTLLFLGEVQRQLIADLLLATDQLCAESFCLSLEKFGCWQHNQIGYIAPSESPPKLEQLVAVLRQKVAAAEFSFDGKTFFPHVTLLRDIVHTVDQHVITPLEWQVGEFALVESMPTKPGPYYRILKTWPLS